MARIKYEDFELQITPVGQKESYCARVRGAGAGDAKAIFRISDLALDNLDQFSGPPTLEVAESFGGSLFNAVFKEEVYACLRRSIDRARRRRARLRIRLNLTEVPELARLPWEFLRNPGQNHFYAPYIETPIVRYLEQPETIEELNITPPLRVLVMVSSPVDYKPLDVEREWDSLKSALRSLEDRRLVELDRLHRATTGALREKLLNSMERDAYHVFHFIGHGEFNEQASEGRLILEDEEGRGRPLNGERLGMMLRDHNTLRLAVINACEGARICKTDSYAGIAPSLLQHGRIPAVIAMQFKISDNAAIIFAGEFYKAVAYGFPIEAALSEARKTIYTEESDVEWATPVLYSRSKEGRFLKVSVTDVEEVPTNGSRSSGQTPVLGRDAESLNAHYESVIDALKSGQLIPFLGLDINLHGRQPEKNWEPGHNLPSNNELTEYLARSFGYPSSDVPDLACVAQYATVKEKGPSQLYEKLLEIFSGCQTVNPIHKFFAKLPGTLQTKKYPHTTDPFLSRFIVVTTTYDNLVEQAFKDGIPEFHVISYIARDEHKGKFLHTKFFNSHTEDRLIPTGGANEYLGLADQNPVILKLPGAVDLVERYQRFAITEDDYFDYLKYIDRSDALPSNLMSKLKRSHHLFLGYSLRDWNVRALFYRLWGDDKPNSESWAIHPDNQDIDNKFWEASHVESISIRLEDYIAGLSRRVEKM
jgi:hypothetical protein